MNDSKLVSVIMPAYNASSTIEESCQSVLNQTYKNLELLIINDGSMDDTLEKVESLQRSDSRIKIITVDNGGASKARNMGIEKSTGDYIAFLDADDLYHPEKIEKQIDFLRSREYDAVITGLQRFTDKKCVRQWLSTTLPPDIRDNARSKILFEISTDKYALFTTVLARKGVFSVGNRYDTSLKTAEDWDLWIRLSVHYKFGNIDSALFYYRKHEQSATAGFSDMMTLNTHLAILDRATDSYDEKRIIINRARSKYLEFFNNALFKGSYREASLIALRGLWPARIFLDRRFYEILKDRILEKIPN